MPAPGVLVIGTVDPPVQQQPFALRTGKAPSLPRITLLFALSGPQVQIDLLHEFSLHRNVTAAAAEVDGDPAISIETSDAETAVWEVRGTVGLFDDAAVEVDGQP